MMEFTFFDRNDAVLFIRNDAETAQWTVHQMDLSLTFPYDPAKVIDRGMRVGFDDSFGDFQYFEIRKVKTYEPDGYQEITAESILISELIDDHFTKAYYWSLIRLGQHTAAEYITHALTYCNANRHLDGTLYAQGSLWQIGNDTTDGTKFNYDGWSDHCSVYQALNGVRDYWDIVYTPRITRNDAQITGRYIDIRPRAGTYRGIYLSLDKNIHETNVLIDDTDVVTAMYGFGKNNGTMQDASWAETDEHPAKPRKQLYIEDPAATAAYGRGGRPRFGYYQNSEINGANNVLGAAWEALKKARIPKITVEGAVTDLYRLGYADQPLALYDAVYVEIRPAGLKYELQISALNINLLDPTQTNVTIGQYYPDINMLNVKTNRMAKSLTRSLPGGGNSSGNTDTEDRSETIDQALGELTGYSLGAGQIKDGDGNMQNVVIWS